MGVFVEVVDGCDAARWAPDLERDGLGVERVEYLTRSAATERAFVNAEDTVEPVYDESGERDYGRDRQHQPESAEQTLPPRARSGGLCCLAASGALGLQRLGPRLSRRHGALQFLNQVRRLLN